MFNNNYYHKYLFLVNNEYKLYSLNEAVDNNLIIHKNEIINKCIKIFKNIYLLNDNIYKLSTIYNKKIFINIIRYLQNNKISNIILPSEIYEEINTGYYINNKLYIQKILYKPHGDLFTYVVSNKFKSNEIYAIFYKIVKIIKNLHKLNISHRDIKLENILIDFSPNLELYLIDFEFANYNNNYNKFNGGTANYAAPELFILDKIIENFNCVDIWALGIILYILLFKTLPWNISNSNKCSYYKEYISNPNILYNKLFILNIPLLHKNIYKKIFKYCFITDYKKRTDINKIFNLL